LTGNGPKKRLAAPYTWGTAVTIPAQPTPQELQLEKEDLKKNDGLF